ncbi:MAG: 6-hydroxymethylpterin diphosphokinase MptE-like protein [Desulfovibrionaceae bacterium]
MNQDIFHHAFDTLDAGDWDGRPVYAFGDVQVDPGIAPDRVTRIPRPGLVKPDRFLESLPEAMLTPPVLFLLPRQADEKEARATRRLQLHLLQHIYASGFNRRAKQPDFKPLKGLMRGVGDPSRGRSQIRNYPWTLRYPLADKLAALRLARPVLVLLPGPSLEPVLPRLPELARHALVVCISRTLKPCLARGVTPDFVVQYDTFMEQRQFYDGIPDLPDTVLVTLASANIDPFAAKFGGIFFRASFHTKINANSYAMRVGLEGSLLACLGLAEALYAPQTYVAGADLSWLPSSGQYAGGSFPTPPAGLTPPDRPQDPRILHVSRSVYRTVRRDGQVVHSNPWFLASVVKAAEAAREIGAGTGGRFFTLDDATLLPPEEFPAATAEDVLALPGLDREAVRAALREALKLREVLDLNLAHAFTLEGEQTLRVNRTLLQLRSMDQAQLPQLVRDPWVQGLRSMRGAYWQFDQPLASTLRLMDVWTEDFAAARKFVQAHRALLKGRSLALLSLRDEAGPWRRELDRLLPGAALETWTAVDPGRANPKDRTFDDYTLPRLLKARDLAFASPGVMNRFEYYWEIMPQDNVYDLRRLGPKV